MKNTRKLFAVLSCIVIMLLAASASAKTITKSEMENLPVIGKIQTATLRGNVSNNNMSWVACTGAVDPYITGTATISFPSGTSGSYKPVMTVALRKKSGSTYATIATVYIGIPTLTPTASRLVWPSKSEAYISYVEGYTLTTGDYKFYYKSSGVTSSTSTLLTGSLIRK